MDKVTVLLRMHSCYKTRSNCCDITIFEWFRLLESFKLYSCIVCVRATSENQFVQNISELY